MDKYHKGPSMQSNSVYLYSNKVDVFTNFGTWITERYQQVYQRNFKVYRGVDNRLDLQVRNSDQKTTDVSGYALIFNLIERETQKLIISRECVVSSAVNGKVYVVLTELDLNEIQPGLYNFSAVTVKDGVTTPLYLDGQHGALGTIEVLGDLFGNTIPSQVIDTFSVIPESWPNGGFSKSEAQFASREVDSTSTLHTFAVYQTNYVGRVEIEASSEIGATPKNWITVGIIEFESQNTGIKYSNIQGAWSYFRIKHTPNMGKFEVTPTRGSIYNVRLKNGGKGYAVNDQFIIKGSRIEGSDQIHDLTIIVTEVDSNGAIVLFTSTGVSNVQTYDQTQIISLGAIDKVMYR
jgi:hypothetical protein